MNNIDSLQPLDPSDWHRVRDMTIPVVEHDGTVQTEMDQAICYTGDVQAYRFFDGSSPETATRLVSILKKIDEPISKGRTTFRIQEDDMSFRVKLGSTVNGRDISLRYLPDHVPSLSDLSLPGALRLLLLDPSLMEGGLVLIVAPQGKGKTTTGSAIIRSRLELYGGFANTVEDPCELPMHGAWGKGVCIQREVTPAAHQESPGEGYYRLLLDTLRQFPAISHGTMLYVGEIGDARTAAETLKAGLNGHLVVATMHARSPADAVRRIADLAAGSRWDNMSSETVRGLLAACLRGVVHQHLKIHKDRTGWEAGEITPSILWNFGESSYVGKAIREGASDRLINVSNKQTDWLRRNSERTVSSTILLEQLQGIS